MGWLFTLGASRKNIIADLTERQESASAIYETLAHCCVGNNLWVVQARTMKATGERIRFIALYLLQRSSDGWGYKDMDETCGPHYFNCPLKYLDMAPEGAVNQYAKDWREAVKTYWAGRQKSCALAAKLKIGDIFRSRRSGTIFAFIEPLGKHWLIAREIESGRVYRVRRPENMEPSPH